MRAWCRIFRFFQGEALSAMLCAPTEAHTKGITPSKKALSAYKPVFRQGDSMASEREKAFWKQRSLGAMPMAVPDTESWAFRCLSDYLPVNIHWVQDWAKQYSKPCMGEECKYCQEEPKAYGVFPVVWAQYLPYTDTIRLKYTRALMVVPGPTVSQILELPYLTDTLIISKMGKNRQDPHKVTLSPKAL